MSQVNRTYIELSEEKRSQIRRAQSQVKEELPELAKRLRMANEAAEENTFSGELRRAIHASGFHLNYIADRVGTTPIVIDEFLTGERTLRTDIIDRLASVLGCTLVSVETKQDAAKLVSSKTQERREIHEYIESGGKTTAMVAERFDKHGLSRLGKLLLDGSYSIAGAPVPNDDELPLEPLNANKPENRKRRLRYANRVLTSKAANSVITVNKPFPRRFN